jgi:hypothetical protein
MMVRAAYATRFLALILGCTIFGVAQDSKSESSDGPSPECSGMYSFLKEGEYVQITVEEHGQVTGFISRYGDGDNGKDAFLDQFFKSARLDGNKLTFTTQTVHGIRFDFKGTVERGAAKNPGDEGYYLLKGALIENSTDANKKTSIRSQNVVLSMFPQEAAAGQAGTQRSPKN